MGEISDTGPSDSDYTQHSTAKPLLSPTSAKKPAARRVIRRSVPRVRQYPTASATEADTA
jgi:hypothetical protein